MAASAGTPRPAGAVDAVLGSYLEALVTGDLSGAQHVLDVALDGGACPRRLYLDVLQPALYEVGRRWSRAEMSVAQEHLATAATERAMARLAARLGEHPAPRGTVVVACPDDELHALSISLPERVELLTRAVAALHELPDPPFVLVGGQAFAGSAERALATGADAYADDAESAVRVLDERFAA